jgi:hypothetical protein
MATVDKQYSDFWLDSDLFEDDDKGADEKGLDLNRVARLAAIRRAIGNFVSILSGKNVPVQFSSGKDSYTTGDAVVISADDDPSKFDVTVGLALHEGSHILLSDFSFLKALNESIRMPMVKHHLPYRLGTPKTGLISARKSVLHDILHPSLRTVLGEVPDNGLGPNNAGNYNAPQSYYDSAFWKNGLMMLDDLQFLMNALEDRRIDQYVYRKAGGYRPYYLALYNRYFFTGEVGKNLRFNPSWRKPTVQNYLNRILYCFHPAARPDALPGLEAIYRRIDLPNISRLAPENDPFVEVTNFLGEKTGEKEPAWWTSAQYKDMPRLWKEANILYAHILRFASLAGETELPMPPMTPIPPMPAAGTEGPKSDLPNLDLGEGTPMMAPAEDGEEAGTESSGELAEEVADALDTDEDENLPDIGGPDDADEMEETPVEMDKKGKGKNEREVEGKFNEKKAEKELKDAKAVMTGDIKKKKITKEENAAVKALESAQGEMVELKGEGIPFGRCMVTRKITKELVDQDWFIFKGWNYREGRADQQTEAALAAGRRMGQIMHHRLMVRNDPLVTKQTRLPQGGLDRRLLANLGMDITSVFQKSRTDIHKPAMLHLTLDASGSMAGKKWLKVITVATALAYVGSKMQNVDTIISIRGGNNMPLVAIVYDSRKEQFNKCIESLRMLRPNGATPEGLAFKATMDLILEQADTHKVYFINFSDGEPAFDIYDTPNLATAARRRFRRFGRVVGGGQGACTYYAGETAAKHTRAMVRMMRDRGVQVLSYFIEDNSGSSYYGKASDNAKNMFRSMYGEDAFFVNVESAGEVVRTLNSRLITRD